MKNPNTIQENCVGPGSTNINPEPSGSDEKPVFNSE